MPDNGLAYTLDSVTLRLRVTSGPFLGLLVQLFGDSGGDPIGPALVTFTNPSFPHGLANFVFVPDTSFTLQPSTTYWIAATGPGVLPRSGFIAWSASSILGTPTGLASSAGYRFSNTGEYPPTGPSSVFNTYQVDATPVHIPSTLLFFGAGFAGFVVWRYRIEKI